jgi:magnesium transporter
VNYLKDPVHRLRVLGRFVRRQLKHPGSAPGTLVHTGPRRMDEVRITVLDYDENELRERVVADDGELWPLRDTATVTWINVDGLHDVELVRRVGERFGIHALALEDVLSLGQRPKAEEYDDHLFVVLSMLGWNAEGGHVVEEQVSLMLGPRWVLTFQERVGDHLDPVRERLRQAKGRIRARGADYLAYAIVDALVDHYFHVLEGIGAVTEELELEVLDCPTRQTMERLHHLKREMMVVRRAAWPLRDMTNGLARSDSALIQQPTRVFLRDVNDHAVQIIDTVESLRDVVSGMIDLYLSNISNRTNEVMKVLTIMASIFIPLTFLAGIYGMNFDIMPELHVVWAYPALLGLMLAVAGGMVLYFRRKGWL